MLDSKTQMPNRRTKILVLTFIIVAILSVSVGSAFYYRGQYTKTCYDYYDLYFDYDSLNQSHESLQSEYQNKQSEYQSLQNDYQSLKYNNELLSIDYNNTKESRDAYKKQFLDYWDATKIRYGDGGDCNLFITPDNPKVIEKTKQILGHSSDNDLSLKDIYDITNWVSKNIEYNHDTFIRNRRECFLYPEETLNLGYGDCEDHALLVVSLCKAEENVSWIWCADVMLEKINKEIVRHTCVFVDIPNDKMLIFDSHYFVIILGQVDYESWLMSEADDEGTELNQYMNLVNYDTVKVLKIYNGSSYHLFRDNLEFQDFF